MRSFSLLFCLLCSTVVSIHSQIITFPYTQSFDSTSTLPVGWTASGFTVSGTSPSSSPNALSAAGNQSAKWTESPQFSFRNHRPAYLRFRERRSSTAASFRLSVSAKTPAGSIQLAVFDAISSTTSYILRTIPLDSVSLSDQELVLFRWEVAADNTNSTGVLRLDDVSVTASSSSDVGISAISVMPQPARSSDLLRIRANIENVGLRTLGAVSVVFYRNQNRATLFTSPFWEQTLADSIASGDSLAIDITDSALPAGQWWFGCAVRHADDGNSTNDTLSVPVNIGHASNTILLTEIMFAPLNDEPEWIELFNPGTAEYNIDGWTISDNSTSTRTPILAGQSTIAGGEYAIIARDASFIANHPGVHIPIIIAPFSSLNNTTPDAVVLRDAIGNMIDSMRYDPTGWLSGGRSLERIDEFASGSNSGNWSFSTDSLLSTPGRTNSIARLYKDIAIRRTRFEPSERRISCSVVNAGRTAIDAYSVSAFVQSPHSSVDSMLVHSESPIPPGDSTEISVRLDTLRPGSTTILLRAEYSGDERASNDTITFTIHNRFAACTVIVNEIMFDPEPGSTEWIELYNPNDAGISLDGWTISDMPTTSGSSNITLLCGTIPPHGFVLAAGDSSLLRWIGGAGNHSPIVIRNSSSALGLNNDADMVILRDLTGETIDSVFYSERWHHPDLSSTAGRSIERIVPALGSNDPRNWTTTVAARGGTPGTVNSVRSPLGPTANGKVRIEPSPFSPDGDGFEDVTIIQYAFSAPSSFVTAKIFDLEGRPVRWLCNFERVGPEGGIIWDGRNDRRERVPLGPYILLLEATSSAVEEPLMFKGVVVVAKKM